jgi:hypothetical protein
MITGAVSTYDYSVKTIRLLINPLTQSAPNNQPVNIGQRSTHSAHYGAIVLSAVCKAS